MTTYDVPFIGKFTSQGRTLSIQPVTGRHRGVGNY